MLSALDSYVAQHPIDPPADADTVEAAGSDGRALRLPGERLVERLKDWIAAPNIILCEDFDRERLGALGALVRTEYDIDAVSRADWLAKTERAMELATQATQEKQYPWPKASSVIYPLITTASIMFAARAYPAIVAGRNVVRGVVVGNDSGVTLQDAMTAAAIAARTSGSTALTPMAPMGVPTMPAPSMGGPVPVAAPQQPGPMPPGQPPQAPQQAPAYLIPPGAKQSQANLIADHMSYQLLDEQEEWEPEMDMLLHVLPIVGCEFKKTYFDPEKGHNVSVRVAAQHVVVNYRAKSLERAPRVTEEVEYYPLEIEGFVDSGLWDDVEGLRENDGESANDCDAPIAFLEQHRWADLDDDGVREPYIVTVHKATSKVVRIVARYDADGIQWNATKGRIQSIKPVHYYTKFDFIPNPDGGIYGVGFGQLLGPLNESINTTLNMLLDAGHLANTQGGFVGKGLNMNTGSLRFRPGEWKIVNAPGATIKDALVPLRFDPPSPVLFQLLGMLVEAGKEIASVKDVLTGDASGANASPTTTLALIEQGLKTFTAIYKRVHRSLKAEYAKLYRLNRLYLDDGAQFKRGEEWIGISQKDYESGAGVEPYSDPTMVSDMQRLGRAQFLLSFMTNPLCDPREILNRVFAAASIDQPEKLFAPAPAPNPAIIAKAMELHTKNTEVEASARLKGAQMVQALTAAIANLAASDRAVGDQHLDWLKHQLDVVKMQMDAESQAVGQQGGAQPQGALA